MPVTDELLTNNESYAASFTKGDLPMPPGKQVAVVACMDARLDPARVLGLEEGDAHVIRNAGGVVTDDVIRSLTISQRLLGTEEIILIHHTDCGMLTFGDEDFRREIQQDTGVKPSWSAETFTDLEEDVRQSIQRIKTSPFIPNKDSPRTPQNLTPTAPGAAPERHLGTFARPGQRGRSGRWVPCSHEQRDRSLPRQARRSSTYANISESPYDIEVDALTDQVGDLNASDVPSRPR